MLAINHAIWWLAPAYAYKLQITLCLSPRSLVLYLSHPPPPPSFRSSTPVPRFHPLLFPKPREVLEGGGWLYFHNKRDILNYSSNGKYNFWIANSSLILLSSSSSSSSSSFFTPSLTRCPVPFYVFYTAPDPPFVRIVTPTTQLQPPPPSFNTPAGLLFRDWYNSRIRNNADSEIDEKREKKKYI